MKNQKNLTCIRKMINRNGCQEDTDVGIISQKFYFFVCVLAFELQVSRLLGRGSTTWVNPQAYLRAILKQLLYKCSKKQLRTLEKKKNGKSQQRIRKHKEPNGNFQIKKVCREISQWNPLEYANKKEK
jgi:hypothetical protein